MEKGISSSASSSSKGEEFSQINQQTSVFVNDLIDLSDSDHSEVTVVKMFQSETNNSSGEPSFNGGDHNRSLLDSPLTPSRDFSPTAGTRYLTTNALANHLFRGRPGGSSTRDASRRSSFGSDDLESVSASDPGGIVVSPEELSELNNRMEKIQKQLDHQRDADDKFIRLKQENAVLREKLNSLEEQLVINEDKWKTQLNDEERKYRDLLTRADREKSLELDALNLRYQLLERDHEQCSIERTKIIEEMERMKIRSQRLEEAVVDSRQELEANENLRRHGEQKLWKEKDEAEKRLLKALEDVEEFRREIELLKNEQGRVDMTASEREEELQRLKEEQKRLRELNDDLHAELLQASVEQGRKLLSANSPSLAQEMDSMSKDQIMETLREQEIVNRKLRVYVDGILLRILEMYPAILEIKPGEKGPDPF